MLLYILQFSDYNFKFHEDARILYGRAVDAVRIRTRFRIVMKYTLFFNAVVNHPSLTNDILLLAFGFIAKKKG